MKQIFTLSVALLFVCHSAWAAGKYKQVNINYQDTTRSFVVYTPNGYDTAAPYPVVFALHGSTSNGAQQIFYSRFDVTADSNRFIIIAPEGLGNVWNSGFTGPYYGTFPDDVGFISKIIDTLPSLYRIDLARVYAQGMSNGGFQSYRLACELSNRIAAIASVTGSMTDSMVYYCAPQRKVPILQIHGTADPLVQYNGEPGVVPIEDVIDFWVNKNQCSTTHDTVALPDINQLDSSTVELIRYLACSDSAEVLFYKITGGGHSWPRAPLDYIFGPTNKDFDASQHIWDFFNRYTINGPVSGVGNLKGARTNAKVYPNPVSGILHVESERNIESVSVCNTMGVVVTHIKVLSSSSLQIDLSALPAGVYIIQIKGRNFTELKRVIKD